MSVKVDVISGFIGAGKTTLINKIIRETSADSKVVVIENEFGEISIDSSILRDAGVEIKDISGGCICCTLFGDFLRAANQLIEQFSPDRIIVEPTGLGRLSDVMNALEAVAGQKDIKINILATVVDPLRFEFCRTMFGEFFFDQIKETNTVVLSRTQMADRELLEGVKEELTQINPGLRILDQSWEEVPDREFLNLLESLADSAEYAHGEICHGEHGDGCHGEGGCPEEHSHYGEHDCHEGHGHHKGHAGHEGHHHGHHDYQEEAHISSVSIVHPRQFSEQEFQEAMNLITSDRDRFGLLIRGKGYFSNTEQEFYLFNYVHEELNLKKEKVPHVEQIVLIGQHLNEEAVKKIFQ